MKLRNTAIALGIGAATATGLSLLKVNKDLVVGSTTVIVGAGLMIALKDKEDPKISSNDLVDEEGEAEELSDFGKSLMRKAHSEGPLVGKDLLNLVSESDHQPCTNNNSSRSNHKILINF